MAERQSLIICRSLKDREIEKKNIYDKADEVLKSQGWSERDALVDEFLFRRHVPLPLVSLHGIYIRPFWRDNKSTPPQPIDGGSGKTYFPVKRKNGRFSFNMPNWEYRS